MPQIGPLEILVVMVVALLVFGPEKLPEMARNLGRTASQLRRMAQDMKDDFSTALDDDDEDRPAPGSGSTRARAAGALPGDDASAADVGDQEDERSSIKNEATADGSGAAEEDDDRSSINADLERLNSQQQDAEAAAATHTGDSKIERGE